MVPQDHKDHPGLKDLRDHKDHLVPLDLLVLQVEQVLEDQLQMYQGLRVHQAPLDLQGRRDSQVQMEKLGFQDLLDQLGQQVPVDQQVH